MGIDTEQKGRILIEIPNPKKVTSRVVSQNNLRGRVAGFQGLPAPSMTYQGLPANYRPATVRLLLRKVRPRNRRTTRTSGAQRSARPTTKRRRKILPTFTDIWLHLPTYHRHKVDHLFTGLTGIWRANYFFEPRIGSDDRGEEKIPNPKSQIAKRRLIMVRIGSVGFGSLRFGSERFGSPTGHFNREIAKYTKGRKGLRRLNRGRSSRIRGKGNRLMD